MSSTRRKNSPLENPFVLDALGLIFLFVFIGIVPPLGSDPGVGWHLKTGQWIIEHRQIPYLDPFLWSTQGVEWISNQWLADIIFWLIFSKGGWDALAIFCFSLPLITMIWVQGRILLRNRSATEDSAVSIKTLLSKIVPFSVLALSLLVAWIQWIVRPVIFSFVLFSILFYWIWKVQYNSEEYSKKTFVLKVFFLFVLWANLHSAFPLGLVLLVSAWAASLINKKYDKAILFFFSIAGALLATLINPYFYKLHLNIIALLGEPYFMKLNNEWLSPSFSDPIFLPLVVALALLLFRSGFNNSLGVWERLVTAIFAVLSLKSVRYVPFFGLILPTLFYGKKNALDPASRLEGERFIPTGTIVMSIALFAFSMLSELPHVEKYSSKIFANSVMWQTLRDECVKSNGRIFNHPDLGGAITFLLGDDCKAGLDDRNELNGVTAYRKFFEVSAADSKLDLSELPSLLVLECKSNLAALSRQGYQGLELKGEFERFCLIGKK